MTIPAIPNQNLINPVKISSIGKFPGFYKSIGLDVVSVASALFFGYAYYDYLTAGFSPWYVFGALLLFASCSVLQVFLAPKTTRRILVLLGEVVALVVFFVPYDGWQILLITVAVVFVILLWGYLSAKSQARNGMEIEFFRVTRNVLGKFTTAMLLAMIILYVPQAEGQGVFIPRESFKTFFDWSSGFFNNFYPNIPLNGSFGDLSQNFAKKELQNNPAFQSLSPSEQNAAIAQQVQNIAGNVAQSTGSAAPTPTESTSDVVYGAIVAMLNGWRNSLQDKFLIVWAIVLFVALRTIGIIFVWAAQFFSLIVYEALLTIGFMHIGEATQTKEIVEY